MYFPISRIALAGNPVKDSPWQDFLEKAPEEGWSASQPPQRVERGGEHLLDARRRRSRLPFPFRGHDQHARARRNGSLDDVLGVFDHRALVWRHAQSFRSAEVKVTGGLGARHICRSDNRVEPGCEAEDLQNEW